MLGFMDYVQNAFYDATRWDRDNSYGTLTATSRSNGTSCMRLEGFADQKQTFLNLIHPMASAFMPLRSLPPTLQRRTP